MAGVFAASQTLDGVSQAAALAAIIAVPGRPLGTSSSWNPLDKNGTTALTGSNLVASGGTSSAVRGTKAHFPLNSAAQGIRQFEIVVGNRGTTDSLYIGVGTGSETLAAPGTTSGQPSVAYRANGTVWANGSQGGSIATWATGDVIGIVVDSRTSGGGVSAYKNGSLVSSSVRTTAFTDPVFPMVGSVGSASWSLTLVTTGLSYPVTGAQEWGAGTPFIESVLAGVSQTATVARPVDRSFAAAQTLSDVSQAATAVVVGGVDRSFAAAQSLAGVSQAASAAVRAVLSGAQTLSGVSQAATAVTAGSRLFAAAQTLGGVSQAAAAAALSGAAAVQTLADVAQVAAVKAIAKAAAIQALDDASCIATAQALVGVQADQTLAGVSQAATATVADTVHAFVAAQVLAAVAQTARMRHRYVFERNERTRDVQAEQRGLVVIAEARSFEVQAESRMVALAGENRRIAFTD